jgi:hypothetical protein
VLLPQHPLGQLSAPTLEAFLLCRHCSCQGPYVGLPATLLHSCWYRDEPTMSHLAANHNLAVRVKLHGGFGAAAAAAAACACRSPRSRPTAQYSAP